MVNDTPDDESSLPKYKRRGFLQKEYALYLGARISTRATQRYGNDDGPIEAIEPISSIRPAHELTDDVNPLDINDI